MVYLCCPPIGTSYNHFKLVKMRASWNKLSNASSIKEGNHSWVWTCVSNACYDLPWQLCKCHMDPNHIIFYSQLFLGGPWRCYHVCQQYCTVLRRFICSVVTILAQLDPGQFPKSLQQLTKTGIINSVEGGSSSHLFPLLRSRWSGPSWGQRSAVVIWFWHEVKLPCLGAHHALNSYCISPNEIICLGVSVPPSCAPTEMEEKTAKLRVLACGGLVWSSFDLKWGPRLGLTSVFYLGQT